MKKLALGFIIVLMVFTVLFVFIAQIRDPKLPETWYPALDTYVQALSDYQIVTFNIPAENLAKTEADTVAVFTPVRAMQIQKSELWLRTRTYPDSACQILLLNGTRNILIAVDTSGQKTLGKIKYYSYSTAINLVANRACTLLVYAIADSAKWTAGTLVIQKKTRKY
jgi:hypothetical protein